MARDTKDPFCQRPTSGPMASPCEGPLWESRGYYVDGSSARLCEKHARWLMRANPAGPIYRPAKEG